MTAPLLEVRGLRMHFPITEGIVRRHAVGEVKAVDGIDFVVQRGETLGLVGESGCGWKNPPPAKSSTTAWTSPRSVRKT
jgi:ABC-type oligopeptide transport system ATPase subunit